jgi:crossover junction endodeoxyribonuclease RusA
LLAGRPPTLTDRIAMVMDVYPPDRRRRDIDNLQKGPLDAMEHAGVYADDSQIDWLLTRRCEVVPDGQLIVQVSTLPLTRCPVCGQTMNLHS